MHLYILASCLSRRVRESVGATRRAYTCVVNAVCRESRSLCIYPAWKGAPVSHRSEPLNWHAAGPLTRCDPPFGISPSLLLRHLVSFFSFTLNLSLSFSFLFFFSPLLSLSLSISSFSLRTRNHDSASVARARSRCRLHRPSTISCCRRSNHGNGNTSYAYKAALRECVAIINGWRILLRACESLRPIDARLYSFEIVR